jgi:DNA repair protein RecO (recombination protein O)
MSYHIYTTPGFILEGRNIGEANKIFSIFTRDLGLISATAQGVRLLKSKLRPHIGTFSCVRISLVRGKEVWRLTSAELVQPYDKELPKEYTHVYVRALSLLKRLLAGEEKNESLYSLLLNAFDFARNLSSPPDFKNFEHLLVLRIVHNLGYVGESKELTPLLNASEWNKEELKRIQDVEKYAITAINSAFKASHL